MSLSFSFKLEHEEIENSFLLMNIFRRRSPFFCVKMHTFSFHIFTKALLSPILIHLILHLWNWIDESNLISLLRIYSNEPTWVSLFLLGKFGSTIINTFILFSSWIWNKWFTIEKQRASRTSNSISYTRSTFNYFLWWLLFICHLHFYKDENTPFFSR